MKKLLALILTLACVSILSACQLGGIGDGKTHVKFYHTMGSNLRTVLDKYIAEFNKTNPTISIDHEQVGSYDDVRDQITTELQAGKQPAIAYCYPDHVASYLRSKKVIDLNTYIHSADPTVALTQAQIDDFIDGYYAEGTQFGDETKMYSLPFSKSTEVLYYNKTFFDENELTVPTTWDQMEELCAKIKKIDPNSVPLGYDSEANWFITMTEQLKTPYTSAGTDHYLWDTAENKAFITRFTEWYTKGYLTTQKLYGGYTSGLFVTQEADKDGKIIRSYMSIGSSAGATHQAPDKTDAGTYPFETGIAPIPQIDAENNPKVISQGPSLCLFDQKDDAVEAAAWQFVKFLLTSADFQAEFSMASGYVPVLESVLENSAYQTFLADANGYDEGISAYSAKVCMDQKDYYYTSPAFVGSSTARDQVGQLLIACLAEKENLPGKIDKLFADSIQTCKTLNP